MTVSTDRVRVWPFAAVCLLACATGVRAGQVELISKAEPSLYSDTAALSPWTLWPGYGLSMSADGRYVAFNSSAVNLVPGQSRRPRGPFSSNGDTDVFVHDRVTGVTALVSHAHGAPATSANEGSWSPRISADGRWILFTSAATDLVPDFVDNSSGVGLSAADLFLYDRVAGTSRLVSHASSSPSATGNSSAVGGAISADGAWVAFSSHASDLIPGQVGGSSSNVFLYSRDSGLILLVSHASSSSSQVGNFESHSPSISEDGSVVAFSSRATNLVPAQSPGNFGGDVFAWDRTNGTIKLVSRIPSSPAESGDDRSYDPVVSGDGRYVAFVSFAKNLVFGQSEPLPGGNVFVHDRQTASTALVSRSSGSPTTTGDGSSFSPRISRDGGYIAFESYASNLIAGLTSYARNAFLYDRTTGGMSLVSHTSASPTAAASNGSILLGLSTDGRRVLFLNESIDLVPGQVDSYGTQDLFLYDRDTGGITLVSHASSSAVTASSGEALSGVLSGNGEWAAFLHSGSGLVAGVRDFNQREDLFLHQRATGGNTLVTRRDPAVASLSPGGVSRSFPLPRTSVSFDGRWVAFISTAPNLVAGQEGSNAQGDVFLRDRSTGVTWLVSRAAGAGNRPGNSPSATPLVSDDGRFVAFGSGAHDLVPGQVEHAFQNVYLWDRQTGAVTLVSHASGSPATEADEFSFLGGLSADGRFVVFHSEASNLIAGQTDGSFSMDVFVWDRASGATSLVSHASGSPATSGGDDSFLPQISADGRFIAFFSYAELAPGTPSGESLWLHDRVAGTNTRVGQAGRPFDPPALSISGDGGVVAFLSDSPALFPGQIDDGEEGDGDWDVFLYERESGEITLASRSIASPLQAGNQISLNPDLSADGRFVVFTSTATDLIAEPDDGFTEDVFSFDRISGTTTRVGISARHPRISADGSRVAFLQNVDNPEEPYPSPVGSVLLFDRTTGTTSLASRRSASAVLPADGESDGALISGDGRSVVFTSFGTNLVPGDLNFTSDVFAYSVVSGQPGRFYTLAPCRLLDSRSTGAFASGVPQTVTAHGACGIPPTATAVAANVTVTGPSAQGHLTLHAGDLPAPGASTINFAAGQTRANNAILPLAANGAGTLAVTPFVLGGGSVHVIVDVTGYFE